MNEFEVEYGKRLAIRRAKILFPVDHTEDEQTGDQK